MNRLCFQKNSLDLFKFCMFLFPSLSEICEIKSTIFLHVYNTIGPQGKISKIMTAFKYKQCVLSLLAWSSFLHLYGNTFRRLLLCYNFKQILQIGYVPLLQPCRQCIFLLYVRERVQIALRKRLSLFCSLGTRFYQVIIATVPSLSHLLFCH